ncbi:MAG: tRNA (adenosine(37)-N6)-threonylcarbamoyltransferase complex ATPase subunit type 1 TsaE [Verrucomicrobia bacterium]|nr:MAG: tRNA (adenosine(37)-N6)-threonylcarbamoyltransferase complex ATPase subunit type 1 TsaE [Verrucomicrobiota bacterium]
MSIFDRLRSGLTTSSAAETHEVATAFGQMLPKDSQLALNGDLGSGKTTFVQGLARAWSIDDPITSPTFNIVNIYRGSRTLVHVDAYRLDRPADMDALMVEDFLNSPYCLAVEWPEHTGDWLSQDHLTVRLVLMPDGRHSLTLM